MMRITGMSKPELGTKRACAHCGARFYDLLQTPITCPKCGTVFGAPKAKSRFQGTPGPEPDAELPVKGPEFVPHEDAEAEAEGAEGSDVVADAEDDDELNGAALVEEEDDGDLDEIEGDDAEAREEN
jgi:uncharacterized protein (TIGR02300 family)